MKNKKSKIISRKPLLIVSILILLILIGLLSFLLTPKKPAIHNEFVAPTDTPNTYISTPTSPTPTYQPPIPSEIKYCDTDECIIEELGIKFPTPPNLNDLTYVTYKQGNDHEWAAFSTKSLMSLSTGCKPTDDPIGILSMISKSNLNENSGNWIYSESELKRVSREWYDSYSKHMLPPLAKEFDKFYILYEGPQSVCAFEDKISKVQTSQVQAFKTVAQNVELIK